MKEDRYCALTEEAKTKIDDASFLPLHQLIEKVREEVKKIVGEHNLSAIDQKVRKIVRGAVESRIDRQLSAKSPSEVKPHRRRKVPIWRDL